MSERKPGERGKRAPGEKRSRGRGGEEPSDEMAEIIARARAADEEKRAAAERAAVADPPLANGVEEGPTPAPEVETFVELPAEKAREPEPKKDVPEQPVARKRTAAPRGVARVEIPEDEEASAREEKKKEALATHVKTNAERRSRSKTNPDGKLRKQGARIEYIGKKKAPKQGVLDTRELARDHAAREQELNSPKEAKAKLDALLTKYGPNTAFNSSPAGALSGKGSTTVEKVSVPRFETSGLDINFTMTHPESSDAGPVFSSSNSKVLTGGTFAFGGERGPTSATYEGGPRFPVPAIRARSEAVVFTPQTPEEVKKLSPESKAANRAESARLSTEEKRAQEFYFAALRRTQKNKSFFDTLGERTGFGKPRDADPLYNTTALREAWVQARAERARHVLGTIDAHHAGRPRGPERARGRAFIVQEAVFRGEEVEQKVRTDALRNRDRELLDKILKSKTAKLVLGGTAVAGATVGAAAAFGGGAVLLGSLATLSAVAGASNLTALALNRKRPGFAKWITFGGWGNMLGTSAGKNLNKKSMGAATSTIGERQAYDIRDSDSFEKMSSERKQAFIDRQRAENRTVVAGGIGAVAVGAGLGAAVGALDSFAGHPLDKLVHSGSTHGEHGSQGATGGGSGTGGEGQHSGHEISARIEHRGEGADKLYADLREKLSEAYRRAGDRPPIVEKMFEFKNMDEFSRATGFERIVHGGDMHAANGHIDSAVMHMEGQGFKADTFTLSADAKTLTYIDSKGVSHVLMQETPQHEVAVQSQNDGWVAMKNYGPQSEAVRGGVPEAEVRPTLGDAAGDAKIAGLNSAQVSGSPAASVQEAPKFTAPITRPLDSTTNV